MASVVDVSRDREGEFDVTVLSPITMAQWTLELLAILEPMEFIFIEIEVI